MTSSRPGFRIAATAALIVAASFIPTKAKAYEDYTSPRNADVNAAGARSIRIEASAGILKVEGRAGITQVRVRGTAISNRRNLLDDIKLIAERRGDEVFIKADMPDDDRYWSRGRNDQMQLDLIIEVPNTIALDVGDGSGEAEFINTGALEFSDGSGEIHIRGGRGDVRINDGSGNIIIEGVQGSVRVRDRKSTRLNSSHLARSRMPSSA